MSGEGFNNPVSNALGTLIRAVLKSINYITGVSGWAIFKNGNAEFASGTFRGTITVTSPNGQKIVIDASTANPQLTFSSVDGTNFSSLSAPNPGGNSNVGIMARSGLFTPGDGIARRSRVYMDDTFGLAQLAIVKDSNGNPKGGQVQLNSTQGFIGYTDTDAAIQQNLVFVVTGATWNVDKVDFLGANVKYSNENTAGALVSYDQGRGIIAVMYYTGGTGATSVGATEVALVAWTAANSCRFKTGRKYSAEVGGGAFTSTAAPSPTEIATVTLRTAVNSIVAQILGTIRVSTPSAGNVNSFERKIYFKNTSGANVDKTSFGLTVLRAAGVGNASIFGNAAPGPTGPLYVIIRDEGLVGETQLDNMMIAIT